jgi:nitric oxide reductase NorE protein
MTERRLPGEEGVWLFIIGDLLIFALFFLTFIFYRAEAESLYLAGQGTLNRNIGLINTLLLLTSSWLVAQSLHCLRKQDAKAARLLLTLGMCGGLGFVALKVVEYREKFAHGYTVLTNDFYMFYFMFTGIHLVHVLIGLGVLLFLRSVTNRAKIGDNEVRLYESGAAFWHLVDLLWVILFALFYLMM